MKRGIPRLAALIVLLMTVACSSTQTPKTVIAPIVSPPSDSARASAIVLASADFPAGWRNSPHVQDPSDKQAERKLMKCSGFPDAKGKTADVFGRDFDLNGPAIANVGSEVMFFKTAALARQDFGTINNQRLLSCVRGVLVELLKASLTKQAPGVKLKSAILKGVNITPYGDESAALRLDATVLANGRSLRFIEDIAGIRKGRVEVQATFFTLGGPFPATLGTSLLETIVARLNSDGGA